MSRTNQRISSDGMRSQNRISSSTSSISPEVKRMIDNGFAGSPLTLAALSELSTSIKKNVFGGSVASNFGLLPICGNTLSDSLYWLFMPSGATFYAVNNNFVSGDYLETGVSAGLKGNGVNKSLNPLLGQQSYSVSSMCIGVYGIEFLTNGAFNCFIGGGGGTNNHTQLVGWSTFAGVGGWIANLDVLGVTVSTVLTSAHFSLNANSATFLGGYVNGVLSGSQTAQRVTAFVGDFSLSVYSRTINGTFPGLYNASNFSSMRCRTAYFSPGLSNQQLASLHSAIDLFNTRLGRNI